jgi:YesN/AraC family two-component response regulator
MLSTRILIVDDEKAIREVLRDFFEGEGFQVSEAEDGMDAVEMAKREPFDVVLTDLKMPGMDGLQVVKEVKHILPDTAALILTGYPSVESAVTAIDMGCDGYLNKPVNLNLLKYMTLRGLIYRKWEQKAIEPEPYP